MGRSEKQADTRHSYRQFGVQSSLIFFFLAVATNANSADISYILNPLPPSIAYTARYTASASLEGAIEPNDEEKVSTFFTFLKKEKAVMIYLDLKGPGGDVSTAIKIGRLVRKFEVNIRVPRDSSCVSSCVLILAGSPIRTIEGRVGIHRPYFRTLPSDSTYDSVRRAFDLLGAATKSYLTEMNVNPDVWDQMVSIPPENVRFLSTRDLDYFRLGGMDPVTEEVLSHDLAKMLGIPRDEFLRRESRANQICNNDASCSWDVLKGLR